MLGDNQLWIERNVPRAWLVAYVKQVLRPEGPYDCDSDAARRLAVRTMERRLHPPKQSPLRHCAGAVKRRLENLIHKRKQP